MPLTWRNVSNVFRRFFGEKKFRQKIRIFGGIDEMRCEESNNLHSKKSSYKAAAFYYCRKFNQ
jgi:hypothetical protein